MKNQLVDGDRKQALSSLFVFSCGNSYNLLELTLRFPGGLNGSCINWSLDKPSWLRYGFHAIRNLVNFTFLQSCEYGLVDLVEYEKLPIEWVLQSCQSP